jgi:hypothetical protein
MISKDVKNISGLILYAFFLGFVLMVIADVVFITITGFRILELSKLSNMSDNSRFIIEKERYKSLVLILAHC